MILKQEYDGSVIVKSYGRKVSYRTLDVGCRGLDTLAVDISNGCTVSSVAHEGYSIFYFLFF